MNLPNPSKLSSVFVVTLAISVVLFLILNSRIHRIQPAMAGDYIVPPSGIAPDGHRVTPSQHRCHAIRYETEQCPYCRKEAPLWNTLATKIKAQGCDIVIVLPQYDVKPLSASVTQAEVIAYPSSVFVESTRLTATPTTILCDDEWRIAWIFSGAMNVSDAEKAEQTLRAL
jgi:hypothetical protein